MVVTRQQAYVALGILGAVIIALLLDRLIVTDRDRIVRVIRDMCGAAGKADVDGLLAHLSQDYYDETMTPPELRKVAESFFARHGPVRVTVRGTAMSLSGRIALAEVTLFARAEDSDRGTLSGQSVWEMEFRKEADGAWRVTRIAPIQIERRGVSGWRSLLRGGWI